MRSRLALALVAGLATAGLGVVACGDDLGTAEPPPAQDSGGFGNTVWDAAFPDAATGGAGGSAGTAGADAGPEPAVDHSDLLPPGVSPPVLWFWRGINQNNLGNWHTDDQGRMCADGDTTMWFKSPGNGACSGAPSCDPDHFGTPEAPCTGVDCSWRNWDDPRGPEFRVSNNTGPVEIHNFGAKGLNGKVPEYGFGVTVCAAPGTVADIDTCPRSNIYSCVEDRYPQFVDDCTTVLLPVAVPPAQFAPTLAGCYSTKGNVTITF